jgi:signal transduction histidine kinase
LRSSYPYLKLFTMLFPPILIGSAEYIRHEWWTDSLSMEAGNVVITVIVFLLSFWFAEWMFHRIGATNDRLTEERARRAVYEERERLAGELHDSLAQSLFFLNVKLQKGDTEEAKSAVAEMNSHLRQAIFNLKTPPEHIEGMERRLQRWLEEWSAVSGVTCRITLRVPEGSFSTSQEVQLFGLIQEAFTNIRKHSRADQASICLTGDSSVWELVIWDNGVGLMPRAGLTGEHKASASGKYGIGMMHKRAEDLGALLTICTPEGGGTEVRAVKGGEREA